MSQVHYLKDGICLALGTVGADLLADALVAHELDEERHDHDHDDRRDGGREEDLVRGIARVAEH